MYTSHTHEPHMLSLFMTSQTQTAWNECPWFCNFQTLIFRPSTDWKFCSYQEGLWCFSSWGLLQVLQLASCIPASSLLVVCTMYVRVMQSTERKQEYMSFSRFEVKSILNPNSKFCVISATHWAETWFEKASSFKPVHSKIISVTMIKMAATRETTARRPCFIQASWGIQDVAQTL